MLTDDERAQEEMFLRARYAATLKPESLERLVSQLCEYSIIRTRDTWLAGSDDIINRASIVRDWEIINIIDADSSLKFLYSNHVASDYRGRFRAGDYVFTSQITNFDKETGLVHTRNSVYSLEGDGEELNATMREAYNMRTLGQSLHTLRNVEGILGPNSYFLGPNTGSSH